jgi:hypothetical protein
MHSCWLVEGIFKSRNRTVRKIDYMLNNMASRDICCYHSVFQQEMGAVDAPGFERAGGRHIQVVRSGGRLQILSRKRERTGTRMDCLPLPDMAHVSHIDRSNAWCFNMFVWLERKVSSLLSCVRYYIGQNSALKINFIKFWQHVEFLYWWVCYVFTILSSTVAPFIS